MLGGRSSDDPDQSFAADDIGEKCIADEKRNAVKDAVFERFFEKLFARHGRIVEGALFVGIAFDEILDFAKHHFHKNGLRTGPAAKYASKCDGEQDNKNNHRNGEQHKQMEILREKSNAKNNELSTEQVHLQKWAAINAQKWTSEKEG